MIPIHHQADGFTIPVRVIPRCSQNTIEVFQPQDEAVRIKITAVPEDGKANQAIITLLSKALSVGKRQIVIVNGEKNRNKVIKVITEQPEQLIEKLLHCLGSPSESTMPIRFVNNHILD